MSARRGVGVGGDDSTMLAQAPWSVAGHAMQPWQLDDPARFASHAASHPGFPTGGCGLLRNEPNTSRCCNERNAKAFNNSLAAVWPPRRGSDSRSSRLIYLDLGANSPGSSIWRFVETYPRGARFEVIAFEADPQWAPQYTAARCASWNARWNASVNCGPFRFIPAAIGVNDTVSYFARSGHSIGRSVKSIRDPMHSVEVHTVDFGRWLRENVRHEDFVVCKMDIELAEFQVLPALLRTPSTLRLLDELMVECHHYETWHVGPHVYKECLQLYQALLAQGVWVHDYY